MTAGTESVENMFLMAMFFLCKFLVFLMFFIAIINAFLTDSVFFDVLISSNLFMYVVGLVGFLYVQDEA